MNPSRTELEGGIIINKKKTRRGFMMEKSIMDKKIEMETTEKQIQTNLLSQPQFWLVENMIEFSEPEIENPAPLFFCLQFFSTSPAFSTGLLSPLFPPKLISAGKGRRACGSPSPDVLPAPFGGRGEGTLSSRVGSSMFRGRRVCGPPPPGGGGNEG